MDSKGNAHFVDIGAGIADDLNSDKPWYPPRPSTASRKPVLKTKGSFTVFFVCPKTGRSMWAESNLEGGLGVMLVTDPRVEELLDQPTAVHYVDDNGKRRRHTFDYLAKCRDGLRVAIAVKPQARVASSGIERIIELIRQQVGPEFADRYVLRTGRHITPTRVANAKYILRAMHHRNDDHVTKVRETTSTLTSAASIADIASASGIGVGTLSAVACLIADGELNIVHEQPLTMRSLVAPAVHRKL